MTVIVERGRIVRLGTSRTLRVPGDARVVDASDKFLITRSARLPIAIVPEVARRFRNFAGFRVADTILFL
jgi:hypothetical protein